MAFRSVPAFALSVLLLAASSTLGAVLVHDGEVGTDESRLESTDAGDDVKVKGALAAFERDLRGSWQTVADLLHHATYVLELEGADTQVLVTGMQSGRDPAVVVIRGAVVWSDTHPDDAARTLLVVDADTVTDPFFAW